MPNDDDTKAPSTGKGRNAEQSDTKSARTTAAASREPTRLYGLRLWQVGLVAASIILMALGIFLGIADGSESPQGNASVSTGTDLPAGVSRGFAPGDAGGGSPGEPVLGPDGEPIADPAATGSEDIWSPAIFRMGFSFFVGFAIAYALRTVARFALVFFGLFLMFLFGLQYAGIVDVQWAVLGDRYEQTSGWLQTQFSSLSAFITGYLPSAGAGMAGLFTGFKRR